MLHSVLKRSVEVCWQPRLQDDISVVADTRNVAYLERRRI